MTLLLELLAPSQTLNAGIIIIISAAEYRPSLLYTILHGSFHVNSTNGPMVTISEFDDFFTKCGPIFLVKDCKVLALYVEK